MWKLNDILLNEWVKEDFAREALNNFEMNINKTSQNLWDVVKAGLRGKLSL